MKNLPQRTREQAQAMQRIKDATVDTAYDAVVAYFKVCGIDSSAAGVHGFLDLLKADGLRKRGYIRNCNDIAGPLNDSLKVNGKIVESSIIVVIEVCWLIENNKNIQDIVEAEHDKNLGHERYWDRVGEFFIRQVFEADKKCPRKLFEQQLYNAFAFSKEEHGQIWESIKCHIERQLQQLTAAPSSPKKEEPVVPPQTQSSDAPPQAQGEANRKNSQPIPAPVPDVQPAGKKSWGKGAMIGGAAGAAVASVGVAGISIGQANTSVYSLLVQSLHSNQIAANAIVVVGAGVLIAVSAAVGAGAQRAIDGG